jgi:PKD repeat protein
MSQIRGLTGDLSGSLVEARDCKKIAVFNGNILTGVPVSETDGFDHIFEQAVPVVLWGNKFAVTASLLRGGDFCRITALNDNTQITINGVPQRIAGERETYEFFLSDSSCYVETSSPCAVYLYQVTHKFDNALYGDPSMVWITPTEQKVKEMTFGTFTATNTINNHYVNIVTATPDIASLTLDNLTISQYFHPLSGNSNLSYARVEISHGTHTIKSHSGFTAFVYGFGDVRGYAYSVGSNAAEGIIDFFCMNDTLVFELTTNYEHDSVVWDLGDGTIIKAKDFVVHSYNNYGNYTVKAIVERNFQSCRGSLYDTITTLVDVFNRKDTIKDTICIGELYDKHGFNIVTYKDTSDVRFVNGMYGCDSTIVLFLTVSDTTPFVFYDTICMGESYSNFGFDIPEDSLNMAGNKFFKKIFLNRFNCDSTHFLYLTINPAYLIEDTLIVCQNSDICCWRNIQLETSTAGTFYIWDSLTTIHNCDSLYKLVFIVKPVLKINAIVNDSLFCQGDTIQFNILNASQFANIQWSGPDGFSPSQSDPNLLASVNHSGIYTVEADSIDNCPVIFDTLEIKVFPPVEVKLQDTLYICDMDTIVPIVTNADYYLWSTGETTKNIAVSSSRIYWLEASNERCVDRDSILVIQIELFDFQIDTAGSLCNDNEMQLSVPNNNGLQYRWNTNDTTSSITISKEGIYTVFLSVGACSISESIEILCPCTLFLPNIFTPVGGKVYLPILTFTLNTFSMHIYDRWGNIVFKTDRFMPWDGTKNGNPVSEGVYYCVVLYTCLGAPDRILTTQSSITVVR